MGPSMVMPEQQHSDRLHSRWIISGGFKLKVAVRTAAKHQSSQQPLLILGGMGASIETLLPVTDALPNRCIVLLDPPGVGQSSTPHWPINMWEYAGLVVAVLDQLDYPHVDILGYSWGGALAQQIAIQYGARCQRLVLAVASAGVFSPAAKPAVMLKYLNPRRLIQPDYVCQIAGDLYGGTPFAE
ncbi:MAG: alpha/beta fold hydrolase [Pseudomonadales bacterium]